mmetsp:Transcript_118334/g.339606  ORF Transcript_118334/g.339606 Transcript_118334/m.339606 type:complete len:228 (+) Transcript_118334:760-1443(+)
MKLSASAVASAGSAVEAAGSRENTGSRPSRRRTRREVARYSKFTAPAGSMVGLTETLAPTPPAPPRNCKQHMVRGAEAPSPDAATPQGAAPASQPMSKCRRRSRFTSSSCDLRRASRIRKSRRSCCAAHSRCTPSPLRSPPSSSLSSKATTPSGSEQRLQTATDSPSESSASSITSAPPIRGVLVPNGANADSNGSSPPNASLMSASNAAIGGCRSADNRALATRNA